MYTYNTPSISTSSRNRIYLFDSLYISKQSYDRSVFIYYSINQIFDPRETIECILRIGLVSHIFLMTLTRRYTCFHSFQH